MDFQLSSGEKIIREFEYGKSKSSGGTLRRSLIVTNKRIISQVQGKGTIARKEIPLSSAEYVTTAVSNARLSLLSVIIFGLLAIAFAVVSFIFPNFGMEITFMPMETLQLIGYGVAGAFALLAIVFLLLFLFKKAGGVEVIIAGRCAETELLSLSSVSGSAAKRTVGAFKISVHKDAAYALVNELGALILDLKSGSYEEPNYDAYEEIDVGQEEVEPPMEEEIPQE